MHSICKFMPSGHFSDQMHAINFVYEADPQKNAALMMSSVYRMHYVTAGCATVRCGNTEREVRAGDIFFIFPAVDFFIRGDAQFRHMYISYMGIRAQAEMEALKITPKRFVFKCPDNVSEFWTCTLSVDTKHLSLACEGVLLYTLAKIGEQYQNDMTLDLPRTTALNAVQIKSFIDEHFTDANLALESIGQHFSYSKNYISTLFKKQFKISIIEYIHMLRINHACLLIEKNHTNITEIAALVGFDDALYFSKVFKKKMGTSPKQYIKEIKG